MRLIHLTILLPLLLGACANTGLRDLRSNSEGPDEFGIQPAKPLEAPPSYSALPAPTPGQANLTDRYPLQEGAIAFGGRLADPNDPVPAGDGALVTHASRLGVTSDIRETLAQTDADFRKRKARFTQFRIVPVDRYNQAYQNQALDAFAEQDRWRRAGARTPSAPPQ
ncbi:MAG: DUF3035 domain-containing protein [Sulfitobacter sp.]